MAQSHSVTLPPGLLQSLLRKSEWKLKRLQQTNTHMLQAKSENSKAVLEEEHSDAIVPSQVEVTKSRKPIKKMINIHVGDAASTCRWDRLTILSHTHTYIMRAVNSAVQPVVTVVSWEVGIMRLI